jgi:hypothetical protein
MKRGRARERREERGTGRERESQTTTENRRGIYVFETASIMIICEDDRNEEIDEEEDTLKKFEFRP